MPSCTTKPKRSIQVSYSIIPSIHASHALTQIDLPPGQRLTANRLHELIDEDEELNPENMTEERKQELMEKLEEHRNTRSSGARVSTKAAAQDAAWTIRSMEKEVSGSSYMPPIDLTCT